MLGQFVDDGHGVAPQVRRPERPLAVQGFENVSSPRRGIGRTRFVSSELGDHEVERRGGEPSQPIVVDPPLRSHGREEPGPPAHAQAEPERAAVSNEPVQRSDGQHAGAMTWR